MRQKFSEVEQQQAGAEPEAADSTGRAEPAVLQLRWSGEWVEAVDYGMGEKDNMGEERSMGEDQTGEQTGEHAAAEWPVAPPEVTVAVDQVHVWGQRAVREDTLDTEKQNKWQRAEHVAQQQHQHQRWLSTSVAVAAVAVVVAAVINSGSTEIKYLQVEQGQWQQQGQKQWQQQQQQQQQEQQQQQQGQQQQQRNTTMTIQEMTKFRANNLEPD